MVFFPIMQLEESEFTCAAAVKARKSMEVEMEDLHVQMEDVSKAKQAVSAPPLPLVPRLLQYSLLPGSRYRGDGARPT